MGHISRTSSAQPTIGPPPAPEAAALDDLRQALRTYRRQGHMGLKVGGGWDGGIACIEATGCLSPAQVRAELQRAGVDENRFRHDLFNVLRINLASRVKQTMTDAEARLGQLQRDPTPLLERLTEVAPVQRQLLLRKIGLQPSEARAVVAAPASARTPLTRALGRAREQIAAARKEADLGALFDRHTASMFKLFQPVARQMGVGRGSFLDGVQQAGQQRCRDAETFDRRMKLAVGIAATVAGGFLVTGVLASAVAGAGQAAISGAPDVLATRHDLQAARGAERLRIASQGAVGRAAAHQRRAARNYGKGVFLGAVAGAAEAALSARGRPLQGTALSLGTDLASRLTDR